MEKQVYVAPKAEFVPLKPEERLMACGKVGTGELCDRDDQEALAQAS